MMNLEGLQSAFIAKLKQEKENRSWMQKQVKVKPNAKKQAIEESTDGSLTVHLKSPPVDGKANKELIELLADQFDVPKSKIRIKSGLSSRTKWVEIDIDA